jgi:hypothetical protein
MSKKILTMTIDVTYEGDYYNADEIPGITEHWIAGGLWDRDDLRGFIVRSTSVEETI